MTDDLSELKQKLNHWHRRAQKAEAELCVTAEARARQGQSIGRRLAGATWHHYKDRAEQAEATLTQLREALETYGRHHANCRQGQTVAPEGVYIWEPASAEPKFGNYIHDSLA